MITPNHNSIFKILKSYNPWWESNTVPEYHLKNYKRSIFYQITQFLEKRTIILSGLRRVGKTTVLYQLIDYLLQKKINPEKIVYLSFDHPVLKDLSLDDILEIYHDEIYSGKDVFYIIDEIQYINDWDRWLKFIFNQQPETQVIATESASSVLLKGQDESGVGHWITFQIPTLSFFEFCEILNIKKPILPENLTISSLLDYSSFEIMKLKDQLKKFQKIFNLYLKLGGFPETASIKEELKAQEILREDIIVKIISYLFNLYRIRNIRDLERIFVHVCNISSNIISLILLLKNLLKFQDLLLKNQCHQFKQNQ